jgi:hypothetical protein
MQDLRAASAHQSILDSQLLALQNDQAGRVDVGHQLVGLLVPAIGVIAFGESEIGRGEFSRGERGDIDPEAFKEGQGVLERQFQSSWRWYGAWSAG